MTHNQKLLAVAGAVLVFGSAAVALHAAARGGAPVSANAGEARADARSLHHPTAPPVELAAGTVLRVRLNRSLSTSEERSGDRFTATLAEPIRAHNRVIVPKGAEVFGVVERAKASGRMKGRAEMELSLRAVRVGDKDVPISTAATVRVSTSHKKRNWMWIGGGSATGALIGGLAGGPAGALIGAGAGSAGGATGAALTGKKQLRIPAETLMAFRLSAPAKVPVVPEGMERTNE